VHALFLGEQRRLGLSHLDPDEGGASLVRTAADTACYLVFAESIQAAPYVTRQCKGVVHVQGFLACLNLSGGASKR